MPDRIPTDFGAGEWQRTIANVDPGSPLPIGHRLQEFVIEGLIGEGGFSIVYLARDTRLGRRVALKEYIPSSLAMRRPDQQVTARSQRHRATFDLGLRSFVNEAQLLASFDHPSLIRVYRFWEENGTAYMVMPYVHGPTLKRWLAEHPGMHGEAWLRSLLASLIDALELIHNDHCYHRDIAPDNILLITNRDGTLRPLLLDFGAARRVIGNATQALTVILKPGYAPIEQYAESAGTKQGPWTDIYALCGVLYTAVTGSVPLPAVSRIISDDLVPASKAAAGRYSVRFLNAIDTGLALRPEHRPQSMQALRGLLGSAGPAAAPAAGAPFEAPARPLPSPPLRARPPEAVESTWEQSFADSRGAPPNVDTRVRRDEDFAADSPTVAPTTSFVAGERRALAAADDKPAAAAPWALRLGLAALAVAIVGVAWWLFSRDGAPAGTAPDAQVSQAPVAPPPRADAPATAPDDAPPAFPAASEAPTPAGEAPGPAPSGRATLPPASTLPSPSALPPPSAIVTPPSAPGFNIVAALQDIVKSASPRYAVSAVSDKPSLTIGRDRLQLRVQSAQAGYLYLFFAGTDKATVYLLYPNRIDRENRIEAGQTVLLPKEGWHFTAGGPPGTTHLVAMVSRHRRDLSSSGLRQAGRGIADFDLRLVQQQRWSPRQGAPAVPFVGRPLCDAGLTCDDAWGAALLQVDEVMAGPRRER